MLNQDITHYQQTQTKYTYDRLLELRKHKPILEIIFQMTLICLIQYGTH